jgi:hypothetical protein
MLLVDDFELFRQFVVELLGKDRNYRSIYVNMPLIFRERRKPFEGFRVFK